MGTPHLILPLILFFFLYTNTCSRLSVWAPISRRPVTRKHEENKEKMPTFPSSPSHLPIPFTIHLARNSPTMSQTFKCTPCPIVPRYTSFDNKHIPSKGTTISSIQISSENTWGTSLAGVVNGERWNRNTGLKLLYEKHHPIHEVDEQQLRHSRLKLKLRQTDKS